MTKFVKKLKVKEQMFDRNNIVEHMTLGITLPIVIPTVADDERSASFAEWRDLLFWNRGICRGDFEQES